MIVGVGCTVTVIDDTAGCPVPVTVSVYVYIPGLGVEDITISSPLVIVPETDVIVAVPL